MGKAPGRRPTTQDEINALLVEHGRAGREVVRLKGGDPFVFARGGEEARALLEAGVAVRGRARHHLGDRRAGLRRHPGDHAPLLDRFTVVTGHEDPVTGRRRHGRLGRRGPGRRHARHPHGGGPHGAPSPSASSPAGGRPDTPAAAVQWGTRPEQRTSGRRWPPSPTSEPGRALAPSWWARWRPRTWPGSRTRPLFGRTGRGDPARGPGHHPGRRPCGRAGAEPIGAPGHRDRRPRRRGRGPRRRPGRRAGYDWLVVTSANGAARVLAGLPDARALGGVSVAAIGPGTANTLAEGNIRADLVPERFVAESLLEAFPGPTGRRQPGPAGPGRSGPRHPARRPPGRGVGRRCRGGLPHRAPPAREPLCSDAAADADIVTFTSSSTVTRYLEVAGRDRVPPIVACIGPVTAATAREAGLTVTVEATEHTMAGLVQALIDHVGAPG